MTVRRRPAPPAAGAAPSAGSASGGAPPSGATASGTSVTTSTAHGCGAWIVVPAYNEAPAIAEVVGKLRALTANVVVVDDGSADSTGREARAAGARVLRHLANRGQGAALQTGIEYALRCGAELVVTFDGDGQHLVDDLQGLLAPLEAGEAEFALGSRFLGSGRSVPPARRLLLRAAVLFTRIASGLPLTDAHNGLRAMTRRAAAALCLRQDRMAHASEIVDQIRASGLPWVEVPVSVRYTRYSRRKGQRGWAALRILTDYLLGRWLA